MKNSDLTKILKTINPAGPVTFISTRNVENRIDFWQSLIQGMAHDGGLLIPERIPSLPKELLLKKKFWLDLDLSDISAVLLRSFIPSNEVSDSELIDMLKDAHNFEIPLEKFKASSIAPNVWIARLDQGPTASFKDIAARALGKLIDLYCVKHNKFINIIVATSGDTGVAVADAFGGSKVVNVTVMYPADGVSEIQEKQMLTVHHTYPNEQVIPVKGNFDVCQDLAKLIQQARGLDSSAIKKLSDDIESKLGVRLQMADLIEITKGVDTLNVSSANSINIWRLLPQMTQYFSSYAWLVKQGEIKPGEEIVFSVPTGNVGHLMAGIYAKELGLPIKLFIAGTNANNVLANIIGSGILKHRGFTKTSSPSMDILDPSNLERLLAYAATKISSDIKIDWQTMKRDIKLDPGLHGIDLTKYGVTQEMIQALQTLVWVEDVETDDEAYAMMRHVAQKENIILEPHGVTAFVGTLRARAKKVIQEQDKVVVFETAHPDKFPEALKAADLPKKKIKAHPRLTKIQKKSFSELKKPKTVNPDIGIVVALMKELSKRNK